MEILTDSCQKLELENKHLLGIIYNKDQQFESKKYESTIISLRKENKRLKSKHNDYETIISEKN